MLRTACAERSAYSCTPKTWRLSTSPTADRSDGVSLGSGIVAKRSAGTNRIAQSVASACYRVKQTSTRRVRNLPADLCAGGLYGRGGRPVESFAYPRVKGAKQDAAIRHSRGVSWAGAGGVDLRAAGGGSGRSGFCRARAAPAATGLWPRRTSANREGPSRFSVGGSPREDDWRADRVANRKSGLEELGAGSSG